MTIAAISEYEIGTRHITIGIIASIMVHIALASILASSYTVIDPQPVIIDVSLITPPKPDLPELQKVEKRQIVSPSETEPSKEVPKDTSNLSDKNYTVEKEQIKRGDPGKGGAKTKKLSSPAPSVKPPSSQDKKIKSLRLDSKTLFDKFGTVLSKPTNESPPALLSSDYSPFSRSQGSGAAFLGVGGVRDYIPGLPDGDITLLNAKASVFAVFVRRVATSVFGQLQFTGWDALRPEDIDSITGSATVTAVLSLKGELLHASIESSSGNSRFDQLLATSVKKGARDKNPPKEAALSDGNIHFIFQARSWVKFVGNRNGGISERRWLLLGTGLE